MSTPESYGDHADLVHVWAVCLTAAQAAGQHGDATIAGRRFPVRIVMPGRPAAQAAITALSRAGYAADRVATPSRGQELVIHGWSAERLDARLAAMRSVIRTLAADPGITAAGVLEEIAEVPATWVPDTRAAVIRQADRGLHDWIGKACGHLGGLDVNAWPSDPGCAQAMTAIHDALDAITDLSVRHVQIAEHALGAYAELRAASSHADARDAALRQARTALPLSSRLTALARARADQGSQPGLGPGAPPAGRSRSRRGTETGPIFPAEGTSDAPSPPPPSPSSRRQNRNYPRGSHH
jgi:hypothetical protein